MKTSINRVAAVIVVAIFIAGNAFAGTACGAQAQHDKNLKAKDAFTRELNLNADQQKRLEQEKTANREAMEALRSALKEKHRELQDAIARPNATKEQVEPILTQIKKLQSDMADKRVDGIFAVKGILSPEQFAKLQSMKEKRMQDGRKKRYQRSR